MLGSKEIEQRIVGSILRHPTAIHSIRDAVKPEDFTDDLMRAIWIVMDELAVEGVTIDRAIVSRRLPPQSNITMPVFLAKLQAEGGDEAAITDFVKELADAVLRRSAKAIFESGGAAMEKVANARAALQAMQAEIIHLLGTGQNAGASLSSLTESVISKTKAKKTRKIYSGLHFVDDVTGPMMGGNLFVLGGSTSAGKSALAGQIAYSVAQRATLSDFDDPTQTLGCPVLYISLEMEPEEIMGRFLAQEIGVGSGAIERGELNFSQEAQLEQARDRVARYPLFIEGMPRATVASILALVMKYQKLNNVGLVVLDHLHYVRGSNRKMDRFAQIEEVVIDLKAAAKQTKIPWLAISHLGRDIAKREDHRPMMGDLYGASEIEKSADVVFFVHRESYWMERERPRESDVAGSAKWQEKFAKVEGKAEIIVQKRRGGKAPASRMCNFDETLTCFSEIRARPASGADRSGSMKDMLDQFQ